QVYQPPTNQPPVYQAQPYQAPAQQVQGVSKTYFENYVKANDAVLRNMQNQGQGLQNQIANLIDMLSKFVNANTASSSATGTLPSNTVTNPKEDLKGITTRSGVAYKGPTIPTTSPPKVVEHETEVKKDTMPPTNNESTEDVQPPVVPVVHHESISEPVNALVSASMPTQKTSIPFPSRRNDERRREKANDQTEKFYEIFRDLSFEISFTDALMLMPKFASTLKTLIGNKKKKPLHSIGPNFREYTANLQSYGRRKRMDVIDIACEEYLKKFLFSNDGPRVAIHCSYYDPIVLLDPSSPPPPNPGNYFPDNSEKIRKICEANSSVNEPPEVELKDLPPHLEYAFLEGDDKLPVIKCKDLKNDGSSSSNRGFKVFHKRAIA
ncbi:hypothetical protein Tco_1018751, partial [Tanacetum coccineum]